MKKIIATLIAVLLLLSNFTVFANDYDTHWSASSIDYLIGKGIVSGNYYGDVNPEGIITRAEFAKIVNRAFGYTDANGEQFPDVSSDKWYYNEMKIARNAGYLTGDANGNSNPEKGITRAEVCVIYSRILNLNITGTYTGFADDALIPDWAKGYVTAMKNTYLLKGYSDNTFKADNPIKRCEAFTVVANQLKQVTPDEKGNVVLDTSGTTINSSYSPSAGGGGGGGGGGSYTPPSNNGLSAPSNLRWDKGDYTVRWASVSGADSYEIKVELVTEGTQLAFADHVETVTDTSYSIKSLVENLMNADSAEKRLKQETFKVSVVAKNSSKTSSPAVINDVVYNNEFIDFPQIEFEQSYVNNVETMKFKWANDENADYYKLEIDFVGDGSYELIGNSEIRNGEAELTSSQINKIMGSYNMRVTAPSKEPNKVLSLKAQITTVDLPLYGGNEEGFNLVYNERHFNNIKHNSDENFKIMQDIVLTAPESITAFAGRLDGNGKSITFDNLTAPLISTLTGSVDSLSLFGSANLTGSNTAILVGLINGGSVKNCINNASFTINSASSYSGGIVGRNMGSITGCINYGNMVSYSASTAPIVGESNGSITKCANYGTITLHDSTSAHGGIVGMHQATSTISECANYGNIITTGNATKVGGIAGEYRGTSTVAFKNCLNSGDISVGAGSGIAGGILASIPHENYDNLIIENCYNAGQILIGGEDTTNANSVYHSVVAGVEGTTITNCYYLISGSTTKKQGSTGLTESKFKDESNFTSFDFEETWKMDNTMGYEYPQLVSIPYKAAPVKLETPSFTDNKLPYNNGTNVEFYVTVPNETSAVFIEVEYNGQKITKEIQGLSQSEYVVSIPSTSFVIGTTYSIKITAKGNGESYFDSDAFSYDYTHKKFLLLAPVLNTEWLADDTDTIVSGDEIYKVSWNAVTSSANLTVNKYSVEINGVDKGTTTDLYYKINPFDFTENLLNVKVTALNDADEVVSNEAVANVDIEFAGVETSDNVTYNLIGCERQFNNISADDTVKNYKVVNNFEMISFTPVAELTGTFDGNGKTINLPSSTAPLFTSVSGKLKNLTVTGSVNLSTAIETGVFVGTNSGEINGCINKAEVTFGQSYTGAIVGYNPAPGKIINCINYGNITIPSATAGHGGIVGTTRSGEAIENCANFGNIVSQSSAYNIGGIVGEIRTNTTTAVKNCFNAGNITAGDVRMGGIFPGFLHDSYDNLKFENCYNSGKLMAGDTDYSNENAMYNWDAGVSGTQFINCYYLTSGTTVGKSGTTGLTDAQMKNRDSFTGFDFDSVWTMPSEGSYFYPILR